MTPFTVTIHPGIKTRAAAARLTDYILHRWRPRGDCTEARGWLLTEVQAIYDDADDDVTVIVRDGGYRPLCDVVRLSPRDEFLAYFTHELERFTDVPT